MPVVARRRVAHRGVGDLNDRVWAEIGRLRAQGLCVCESRARVSPAKGLIAVA